MSELFLSFFNRAMAAGWVALAVIVLRLLLKKAPKWVDCLLWALVGVRLVWPFSLQSRLSLVPSREVLPPETLFDPTPAVQTGIEFVNQQVNTSFTPAMTAAELTSINPLQVWTWVAGWIWALGAAMLLMWALVSWLRLRKQVAASVERDGLWYCDGLASPFILGVFRPRIYVPSDLPPEALCHVTAHEQAHLRRRDHWWKPLAYVLLVLHWFHPLLWAAYILLCRDIELACDARVAQKLDLTEKKAYARALLSCSVSRHSVAACPLAFGEVGVRQRIRSVLHYKKPAFWIVAVCVVLCIVLAVCFLTDPKEDAIIKEGCYISSVCVYADPHRQNYDQKDSGCYYRCTESQFEIVDRTNKFVVPYELEELQWQPLSISETEWNALFEGTPVDLLEYKKRDYLELDEAYMLLRLDEHYWIVMKGRQTIWSIYALEPVSSEQIAIQIYETDVFTDTLNGNAYYSSDCIYMNPLSSTMATENSGSYYYVQDSVFVTGYRRTMTEQAVPVHWSWQVFPWTAEEWNEKFWGEPVDISDYTERKVQPLDPEHYLLKMDEELWLVEDHGDTRTGIWSIYRLQQAESLSEAQWRYMEGAGQPLTIQFDLEYDEIQLTCDGGALHGAYTNVNDDKLHYYGDQILYWTAAASEDAADVAWEAEIFFTGYLDGEEQFYGSIRTSFDRNGDVWVNGGTLGGNQEMRMDREDHFVRIYRREDPNDNPFGAWLAELQPHEIGSIVWAGMNEPPTADVLLPMIRKACEHPVNPEAFSAHWSLHVYVGSRDKKTWNADDSFKLQVGLVEPVVRISGGGNLPEGDLYVEDEELYWMLRTMYDTEPRGINEKIYRKYRKWIDPLLTETDGLPPAHYDVTVTRELTGLLLQDASVKLNAKAYGVDIIWNVEPKERAFDLLAGGALVDSQLRIHGMNASQRYLIVVDDEPIGFVGWWFLMDKTLDEQFDTKEALIAAVLNDG